MALLHTSSHLLGSPPPAPPAPLYSSRPLTVPPPERAAPHTFPSEASPHASGLSSNPPAPREAFPGLPSLRHFTRFYSHHPHRDLKLFSLRTSLPVSLALKYKFGEAKNPLVLFTAVSPRASNGSLGAQYVEGTDAHQLLTRQVQVRILQHEAAVRVRGHGPSGFVKTRS